MEDEGSMRVETEPNPNKSISHIKPLKHYSSGVGMRGRNTKVKGTETTRTKETTLYSVSGTINRKAKQEKESPKANYTRLVEKTIKNESEYLRQKQKQQLSTSSFYQKSAFGSLNERMEQFTQRVEEKRKERKVEDEYRQYKECTFMPSVNFKGRTANRAILDFYSDQMSYLNNTQRKLKEARDLSKLQAAQETTLSPKICKTSRKIFDQISAEYQTMSVYQRLASHSKEKQKRDKTMREANKTIVPEIDLEAFPYRSKTPMRSAAFQFQPVILRKSKNMKREKSVGELLYHKAMERLRSHSNKRQEINELIDENARSSHMLKQSQAYLNGKFEGLFQGYWEKVAGCSNTLTDKSTLTMLLETLGFVKDSIKESIYVKAVWKMLSSVSSEQPATVTKEAVYKFLKAVLGAESTQIHTQFLPLYFNYTATHVPHSRSSFSRYCLETTFKPAINHLSRKMVARSRSQLSFSGSKHFESLLIKGEEYEERRRARVLERSLTQSELCTFHPNIEKSQKSRTRSQLSLYPTLKDAIGSYSPSKTEGFSFITPRSTSYGYTAYNKNRRHKDLYEHARTLAEKRSVEFSRNLESKELEEAKTCTFKPAINKKRGRSKVLSRASQAAVSTCITSPRELSEGKV